MVILPIFMFLVGFPYDRYYSRIKEKGQRPFHSSHIIPQQRVGTEIMALFWEQKFGVFLFLIGDNFYSLDPIRKPPFLRG
jgi:hypothetical protein